VFYNGRKFSNLDNILHDWAKDKYKKKFIVQALNRYVKYSRAGKKKGKAVSFLENG